MAVPASAFSQESAGAILRSSGTGVSVNRSAAPASIALYRDDLIETQQKAVARIEISGSSADISPETIVQFRSDELFLDHGTIAVNTTRGLKVRVGCVTITPVSDSDWTHYEVTDSSGKVTVSAIKSDVYIERSNKPQSAKASERSSRDIVKETEQKSRDEKCAGAALHSAAPPGIEPVLNSPWAIGLGAGGVVTITCFALCRNSSPMSPAKP